MERSNILETIAEHLAQEALRPVEAEEAASAPTTVSEAAHAGRDQRLQEDVQQEGDTQQKQGSRRICGLAPGAFWTILAVVIACIIAAIIGGVAASRTTKNHSSPKSTSTTVASVQSSPSSNVSPSAPSTTLLTHATNGASTTTSEISNPTAALYRDCPSVDDTIYSFGAAGAPLFFRQWCGRACFNINGRDAIVNQRTPSLAECIDLCASYNIANGSDITVGEKAACNSVCWRNTWDTDFPGQCFGYTTRNVSGQWNISESSICDSAGWINQGM